MGIGNLNCGARFPGARADRQDLQAGERARRRDPNPGGREEGLRRAGQGPRLCLF